MKSSLVARVFLLSFPVLLSGCALQQDVSPVAVQANLQIKGSLYGGQQPVAQSHVYLMAVTTNGYGKPAQSLLTTGDGADSVGTYVSTDSNGGFLLTGKYTCTANTEVYALALGGKSSPTTAANNGIALMATLGKCPGTATFAGTVSNISINEVTTAAAAYALSGFMTGPTMASSSGTALASVGVDNAFSTSASLADITSGSSNATVGSNGTASVSKLNTIANMIAACVNSDGTGPACSTLYRNSRNGSVTPTDTITALLNIAHNPGANVMQLFGLTNAQAPFQPSLAAMPNDFALTIQYTTPNLSTPQNVRADAAGNIWFRDTSNNTNTIEKLSPTGSVLSGSNGFMAGGQNGAASIALDAQGNAFLGNSSAFSVYKLTASGAIASPDSGFAASCSNPNAKAFSVAVDANGSVWGSGSGDCALKITNLGTVLSGANGYPSTSDESLSLALDSTNSAWITGVANNVVRRVSANGTLIAEYGNSVYMPYGIAMDSADTAWIANHAMNLLTHLYMDGSSVMFSGGGLVSPNDISIDGLGSVWVANTAPYISAFANSGTALSSGNGYQAANSGSVRSITADGSGNVWTVLDGPDAIVEFVGLAAPAARPIMPGRLGVRP